MVTNLTNFQFSLRWTGLLKFNLAVLKLWLCSQRMPSVTVDGIHWLVHACNPWRNGSSYQLSSAIINYHSPYPSYLYLLLFCSVSNETTFSGPLPKWQTVTLFFFFFWSWLKICQGAHITVEGFHKGPHKDLCRLLIDLQCLLWLNKPFKMCMSV